MIGSGRCFIMLCNKYTEKECLGRNLFGDRKYRLEYLSEIEIGNIGFLLNTTTDELIGVFKAVSQTELDIVSDAWQGEFQAQVQVEPVGHLKRIKNAVTILAKAGIGMIDLKPKVIVPILPVQNQDVCKKLLVYYVGNNSSLM